LRQGIKQDTEKGTGHNHGQENPFDKIFSLQWPFQGIEIKDVKSDRENDKCQQAGTGFCRENIIIAAKSDPLGNFYGEEYERQVSTKKEEFKNKGSNFHR
jgi:hypothetical protein